MMETLQRTKLKLKISQSAAWRVRNLIDHLRASRVRSAKRVKKLTSQKKTRLKRNEVSVFSQGSAQLDLSLLKTESRRENS